VHWIVNLLAAAAVLWPIVRFVRDKTHNSRLRRHFLRQVRKHGWSYVYVPAAPTVFSHSMGVSITLEAPEIFLSGADPDASANLIYTAYEQMKSGELVLQDKAEWNPGWGPEDGEPLPRVAWRAVHPTQIARYFDLAIWCRTKMEKDGMAMDAFQLVFGDSEGILPWEEGFDWNYQPRQALLWLPHRERPIAAFDRP